MESRGCAIHSIGPNRAKLHFENQGYGYIPTKTVMLLCHHFLEFQNEAWSSLNQLNGGCDPPPTYPLVPLAFEYLPLMQVYTFFFVGDCITGGGQKLCTGRVVLPVADNIFK